MGYFDYYDVCQKMIAKMAVLQSYFFRELEYSASEGSLIIVTYDHLIA